MNLKSKWKVDLKLISLLIVQTYFFIKNFNQIDVHKFIVWRSSSILASHQFFSIFKNWTLLGTYLKQKAHNQN
jgi:hypothetical protein